MRAPGRSGRGDRHPPAPPSGARAGGWRLLAPGRPAAPRRGTCGGAARRRLDDARCDRGAPRRRRAGHAKRHAADRPLPTPEPGARADRRRVDPRRNARPSRGDRPSALATVLRSLRSSSWASARVTRSRIRWPWLSWRTLVLEPLHALRRPGAVRSFSALPSVLRLASTRRTRKWGRASSNRPRGYPMERPSLRSSRIRWAVRRRPSRWLSPASSWRRRPRRTRSRAGRACGGRARRRNRPGRVTRLQAPPSGSASRRPPSGDATEPSSFPSRRSSTTSAAGRGSTRARAVDLRPGTCRRSADHGRERRALRPGRGPARRSRRSGQPSSTAPSSRSTTEPGRRSVAMRWLVGSSLRYRWLVVFGAVALMVYGVSDVRSTPVDVFPEFAPPRVESRRRRSASPPRSRSSSPSPRAEPRRRREPGRRALNLGRAALLDHAPLRTGTDWLKRGSSSRNGSPRWRPPCRAGPPCP